MSQARAVTVSVRGHVQGVGFRAWTAERARSLGLGGWVRNRRDGTVEAAFAGESATVASMLSAIRHGPPGARVDSVTEEPLATGDLPASFEQRATI